MNESVSSSGAQVAAAGLSSLTLALVGLPYLALLWAFIGAVAVLVLLPPENKGRALITILASGLIGAAAGYGVASFIGGGNPALIGFSMIGGAGAKPILSSLIEAAQIYIKKQADK